MTKRKGILIIGIVALLLFQLTLTGQTTKPKPIVKQRGLAGFPELMFTNIPGAVHLTAPVLINGTEKPIISEGFGLAAPAFYDWDGDGIKDLLVGEFGSGLEHGNMTGHFIRVFKNTGTDEQPAFTGRWYYASPLATKILGTGTPYSVPQFCCMSFTPQFIDVNNDGYADMVTGTCYGDVMWFRGSKEGFLNAEPLNEGINPRLENAVERYWFYSSASMGDVTNDGKPDIITGGASLRISINVGTESNPVFSLRDTLRDLDGNPLKIYEYTAQEKKSNDANEKALGPAAAAPVAGDEKLSPTVIDWDNDGVLDLLVTNSYSRYPFSVIDFFKGVQVQKKNSRDLGIRFQKPVSLFTAKDGSKPFPGSGPRIVVCDWNNDGVNDLLIGTSIETVNDQLSNRLMWEWEDDNKLHGPGKAPGFLELEGEALQRQKQYYIRHGIPKGMTIEEYMSIKHVGVVYVMLGRAADKAGKK